MIFKETINPFFNRPDKLKRVAGFKKQIKLCEVIYEMFHKLNCGFEIKSAMINAVTNAI